MSKLIPMTQPEFDVHIEEEFRGRGMANKSCY
jgi:hypothetical protein